MNKRQRETINFFSRYIIDNKALKKSENKRKDENTCRVAEKLDVEKENLIADFSPSSDLWDRRIYYEVTRRYLDDDDIEDFKSDDSSDDTSSVNKKKDKAKKKVKQLSTSLLNES